MNRILPLIAFAAFSLSACEVKIGDDKPEEPYDVTVPIEKFSIDSFPFIDCSTSTMPLRNMVMLHLMDIPYRWGYDVVSGSQYSITWALPEGVAEGSAEHKALASALNPKMILCNGSHDAYVNLIDSVTDLIIDSRNISRNELEYSASRNVNIITRPLAWDAMVFIVHPSNRVKSLTVEQIQKIYTGEITNWKQVGGDDKVIHPYTRDPDSGSQEKMETMVMKGLQMKVWPEMQLHTMLSPYFSVEMDECGIAYSPYYFCERMVKDLRNVKVIALDGVMPDKESILAGAAGKKKNAYPFSSNIYVAIREDEPAQSGIHNIFDWLLLDKDAKNLIDESGYIAVR